MEINWQETALWTITEGIIYAIFATRMLKSKLHPVFTVLIWIVVSTIFYMFSMGVDNVLLQWLHSRGFSNVFLDSVYVIKAVVMQVGIYGMIVLLFKDSLKRKILVGLFFTACGVIIELVIALIFYLSAGIVITKDCPDIVLTTGRMLSPALYSFFSIFTMMFLSRYDRKELLWMVAVQFLLLVGEIAFVMMMFLGSNSFLENHIIQVYLLVFLPTITANYLSSLVLQHVYSLRVKEAKLAFAEEMGEQEYAYYQLALENENTIRELRHETANQLQMMAALLQLGEEERANRLTGELMERFRTTVRIAYCDNQIINIILSIKTEEANKKGITMEHRVQPVLGDVKLEDMDLSMVLTNLLDNAIRGCEALTDAGGKVQCEIGYKHGSFVIRVSNDTDINTEENNLTELETTKTDKKRHGVGLTLVKKIAAKYEGDFSVKLENGTFIAMMVI